MSPEIGIPTEELIDSIYDTPDGIDAAEIIERESSLLNPEFLQDVEVYSNGEYEVSVPNTLMPIFEQLEEQGGLGLVVGGAVRDVVISKEFDTEIASRHDLDIEVFGMTENDLLSLLKDNFGEVSVARNERTDQNYPVYTIQLPGIPEPIDFALARTEVSTGPSKEDFEISTDPSLGFAEASIRRDLNVNALAYNPLTRSVYDAYGGVESIKSHEISVTNVETFKEDPSRSLRAIKYASRYDMTLSDSCLNACREVVLQGGFAELSSRQVTSEVEAILMESPRPSVGLALLDEVGIVKNHWSELLPASAEGEGVLSKKTLIAIDRLSAASQEADISYEDTLVLKFASIGVCQVSEGRTENMSTFLSHFDQITGTARGAQRVEQKTTAILEVYDRIRQVYSSYEDKKEAGQVFLEEQAHLLQQLKRTGISGEAFVLVAKADIASSHQDGEGLDSWTGWLAQQVEVFTNEIRESERRDALLSARDLIERSGEKPGGWVRTVLKAVKAEEGLHTTDEAYDRAMAYREQFARYVEKRVQDDSKLRANKVWAELSRMEDPTEVLGS